MTQRNFEQNQEKEPSEKILEKIKEAIEKQKEIKITQKKANGEEIINNAFPLSIEGNNLTIDAESFGLDIKIDSIFDVEIIGNNNG